jgi:hypothetical protein
MNNKDIFECNTPFCVTDGNGVARHQTSERSDSQAYTEALENGLLYKDENGELRLLGDEETQREILWNKLKAPSLPVMYDFEIPSYASMKPYRTGSMTEARIHWKTAEQIATETEAEYLEKYGRKPSQAALVKAGQNAEEFRNRFKAARPYEMYVAQLFWNNCLTPFLDTALIPSEKSAHNKDQADIFVAGKLIEVKSHWQFFHPEPNRYPTDLLEDGGLFVCNVESVKNQTQPRDFYVLVSKAYLAWQYEKEMNGDKVWKEYTPLALPFTPDAWEVKTKTDHKRGYDYNAYFAKPSQLISWKELLQELKNHREQLSATSRQLEDIEVVELFYHHLTETELEVQLQEEHTKALRYKQQQQQAQQQQQSDLLDCIFNT